MDYTQLQHRFVMCRFFGSCSLLIAVALPSLFIIGFGSLLRIYSDTIDVQYGVFGQAGLDR